MPLDKIAADALIYAGGAAFSALVSSGNNAWSASENRKSSESISRLNRDSSEEIARLSRKHSAELQYNQLKFSVLQQRENQEFQRELAELNHERAKEIEAFRAQVNFAINQKNLDFQKWRFEQEKKIQYDILQLQQDFQRDLTQIQHQNALIQMRERLREDKSPIANLASDLLENSFAHGIMPLKVLLAPPSLDYDPSSGKPYQASYEGFLSKEIEQFLHQGYLNSKQYPVQLLDKAWESNKRGGGSALQALHAQLKSIPILVLESEIPLGELNFRAGYWSGGDVSYTQATILSGQSVADLLNNSAKKRALEWEITRQKLQALGKDEAYIKNMGGVNEENLQIFYKELAEKEELEKHGIDTSNLPIGKEYKITDQDYKSFYEYLAVWHCLVIGLYADILFLGNSWENTPLLPSLIPYLLEKSGINSLLAGWQLLNRFGNIPHLPALVTGGESMTVEEKVKPNMPNITENFTEVLRNGIELEMIAIPPGDFILLGDKPTVVKLKGFWMSKYPITQAQYEAIMFYNPSYFRGDSNHPVEQVTWDNAQEFCGKLSEKTGKSYQLPSEVQWVYSCKAGSTTSWYFGDLACEDGAVDFGDLACEDGVVDFREYAWYGKNSGKRTHPVGQKKPNQWGLYDMYGNVYEWCQDSYYSGNEYLFSPQDPRYMDSYMDSHSPSPIYPTDGSAFVESGNQFIVKSSSFLTDLEYTSTTNSTQEFRNFTFPSNRNVIYQNPEFMKQVGFRVVCVP